MTKKDLGLVTIIGVLVGLLSQLMLNNLAAETWAKIPMDPFVFRLAVFFGFTLLAPIALTVLHLLSKKIAVLFQFGKFAAVGSLNSFVDLGVLNGLTYFVSSAPGDFVFGLFKSISFLAATTNSYAWNRTWTFQAQGSANVGEGAKFYLIALINYFLNVGTAVISRKIFLAAGLDFSLATNLLAPVCGFLVGFIGNFIGYKFVVFKDSAKTS